LNFPGGSDSKESVFNARKPGLIPVWGTSSAEGNDKPLEYSFLENSMDRGGWWSTGHGFKNS